MQFHFEPNLEFQNAARSAVLRLFRGQPFLEAAALLGHGENAALDTKKLFQNTREILRQANTSATFSGEREFSVEMETGVGKTYVYLRTIYDLYTQQRLQKFIIIVPNVAVREGVMKALEQTRQHFAALYQGVQAEARQYDGTKPNTVRDFCDSSQLSILVMNTQAFSGDKNILHDEHRDQGYLLARIQEVRPILILDEPQMGMDTPNMQRRLHGLQSLLQLRYSATHRAPKNLIHRLTPYEAYSQGLVKRVAVYGVREEHTHSAAPVLFEEGVFTQAAPKARLRIHRREPGGVKEQARVTVAAGDDLEEKSGGLSQYRGWQVADIRKDLASGEVQLLFTNGRALLEKHGSRPQQEEIFRTQIGQAILQHFRAKERLIPRGIKPLALFFIDRVRHYTEADGIIRRLFVEQYQALYHQHYGRPPANVPAVHNGYFAHNKRGYIEDKNIIRELKEVREIYALIMRDKERLLSFEEPLEFIFSHSALGVGWDNPNVFTLCTLNETKSELKKRQEIGRGLRLPVNQQGLRWRDAPHAQESRRLNTLAVVVNESYREFVSAYQQELLEQYEHASATPPIIDLKAEPQKMRLNRSRLSAADFKALWRRMALKTRWLPFFDEEALVQKCVAALAAITTVPQRIVTEAGRLRGFSASGRAQVEHLGREISHSVEQPQPNTAQLLPDFAKVTTLGWRTATRVLKAVADQHEQTILQNPQQFMALAASRIHHVLHQELVSMVHYEPSGESWPLETFEDQETCNETFPTPLRGLYDRMAWESQVEKNFAGLLENSDTVRVFVKLPRWYTIDTPVGEYHPDFALAIESKALHQEGSQRFFYVVETKGSSSPGALREDEKQKIACAIRHFKAIGFEHYLAPVSDQASFNQKATEAHGDTRGNLP